ncbi:hypothetical protein D1007_07629 [Hordeum vulgare]|nr:hypothetical protein D1007_07629 [Hordeum vulgare]
MCYDWWGPPRATSSRVNRPLLDDDCVTILDSTVHVWASGAAVCIFSGRGSNFFSAVVERLSRQLAKSRLDRSAGAELDGARRQFFKSMAAQLEDDVWVSQKNMLALLTEPTVVDEDTGIDADGEEGTHGARKIVVDWNVVELNEKTYLVITPISDIDMAEMFGIQVDDKHKEKDDNYLRVDGNTGPRNANEDEEELMRMAADDVDDTNENELVCLYDKENPFIEVGKLWPSMLDFRMSFRTFAVKKEFEAKTMWTDRKKFYARCKGYDGGGNAFKWRKRAEKAPPLVVEQCWPVKKGRLNGFRRKRTIIAETVTAEHELTETVTGEHEQTETVTAEHELTETVTESFLQALGQSETVADEATVLLACLEVVLPSVEHEKTETVTESALTAVLPCLEVVLPSVELQTEEVEQCVPST